jgi:hypothetical protein
MRRGRFRHVVEMTILKSVRPELLAAFLRPFSTELRSAGLALPVAPSTAWLEELGAMLNRDEPVLPAALQAALVGIADLATPAGHEEIMALADERGIAVFVGKETIPQEDLAFLVYLEHPDLFRAARSRVKAFAPRLFVEFHGNQRRISSTQGTASARLAIVKGRLVSWLQKRNRTGACLVRADDFDDQLVFSIAHGAAPTRGSEVHRRASHNRAGRIPEQQDIIIFDKQEDRLSVSAQLPSERELYRALFGFVLFLDEGYFRVVRLYHSRPLREQGSAALHVTGIEGLERVSLKRLTFVSRDRLHSKMEVTSDDLGEWLDSRRTKILLRQRPIGSWTLGFRLRHDTSALDVDVWPPNQLRVDRRLRTELVHQFLRARGFEYRSSDADAPPSSR